MLYSSAQAWRDAPSRHVCLFAMSGLGKTHVSNMLRDAGTWFHYSVDYRIGTRYMGEHIADNFKAEAMKNPFLADLLRSDSIRVESNITFENLAPLSTYLGKPGDPSKGGLPIDEYRRRQAQHDAAERATLLDTVHFIDRAKRLYDYPHFVCDTGGSICEVVDPSDRDDPILKALSKHTLMVWIKDTEDHRDELIRRFDRAPKPMCYQPAFLTETWNAYLAQTGTQPEDVDPDAFVRWAYARALAHRHPIYAAMANWGVTVEAKDIAQVQSEADFVDVIAEAIERRTKSA